MKVFELMTDSLQYCCELPIDGEKKVVRITKERQMNVTFTYY